MFSMDSRAGSSVEYFSLITFRDVPESYSTLTDVVCCFTRASNMTPEPADYVAIFPVGWHSVDEYVCSQPVKVSVDSETSSLCTHSVTFPAASLPRDNDEFFHFCYVSASDRRVRGVSTPFQFVSDRQNEWELLDPPTVNGESFEHDAVQQQQWQQPKVIDESSQVSLSLSAQNFQAEVESLKQELLNKQQELEKRALDYSSAMDAMQLSLDEITRKCSDKDSKLEQLRTTLEQYEKLEEKHKSELETLKSTHATSLVGQASDCQMQKLQIENDRICIEQLKQALNSYQQREAEWIQHETDLLSEIEKLRTAGADSAVPGNVETATEHPVAAAAEGDEQQRDVTTTDYVEETPREEEHFEDASDIPVDRTCPICSMTFSTSEPAELFISHVEDHVVKVCPVCSQEFQPEDETFIIHVNVCLSSNEQQQQQQQQQQPEVPLPDINYV